MMNFLSYEREKMSITTKVEIINLLAYLSNQNNEFKSLISKSDKLIKNLNSLILQNSNDEESNKAISLAIAQLPVEELNMISQHSS